MSLLKEKVKKGAFLELSSFSMLSWKNWAQKGGKKMEPIADLPLETSFKHLTSIFY